MSAARPRPGRPMLRGLANGLAISIALYALVGLAVFLVARSKAARGELGISLSQGPR